MTSIRSLLALAAAVVASALAAADTAADLLARLQKTTDAAGQDALIRQLTPQPSAAAIPVLAKLALQPDPVGHLAIAALMANPSNAAAQALRDALPNAPAQNQLVLMDALGRRRVASATEALVALLNHTATDAQPAAALDAHAQ
ncbi:MAG: hypothetical protein LBR12_04515, partial [Opitutaceae bacterium]|nr:hypothetical protein [Opitutaceae bacterium]